MLHMTGTIALLQKVSEMQQADVFCVTRFALRLVVSPQDERRRVEAVQPAPVNMVTRPCGGGRCSTTVHRWQGSETGGAF